LQNTFFEEKPTQKETPEVVTPREFKLGSGGALLCEVEEDLPEVEVFVSAA